MIDDKPELTIEDVRELRQLVLAKILVTPLITSFDIRRHRREIEQHKQRVKAENCRRQAGEHFAYMSGALARFRSESFVKLLDIRLDEAAELLEMVGETAIKS